MGLDNMCLANVYLVKGDKEELICQDIELLEIHDEEIQLRDFLGRTTTVKGMLLSSDMSLNKVRIAAADV